ncbi:TPA: hypothetical protein ACO4BI_004140 [Escherichia coli]
MSKLMIVLVVLLSLAVAGLFTTSLELEVRLSDVEYETEDDE